MHTMNERTNDCVCTRICVRLCLDDKTERDRQLIGYLIIHSMKNICDK